MRKITMLLAALTLSVVQNACVTVSRTRTVAGPTVVDTIGFDTIRSSSMRAEVETHVFEDLLPFDGPQEAETLLTNARFQEALSGYPCASEQDRNNLRVQLRNATSAAQQDQILQQFGQSHPACPGVQVAPRQIVVAQSQPRVGNYTRTSHSRYIAPGSVTAYRTGGYGANESRLRQEAARLLDPQTAEDRRLRACIDRSGLTPNQVTEYLRKLATGQFTTKTVPRYIRINGSCGGRNGTFIETFQAEGETFLALYAEVVLSDGTVVGAGSHCWNMTFPTQFARVSITTSREQEQMEIRPRTRERTTTRSETYTRRVFYCFASLDRAGLCAAVVGAGIFAGTRGGEEDGNKTEGRPPVRVNRIPVP